MRRQAIIALSAALVALSLTGRNAEARLPCIDQNLCVEYCPGDVAGVCQLYRPQYCQLVNAGCNDPGFGCLGGEPGDDVQIWCDFENI
jgi:hypothetical protein